MSTRMRVTAHYGHTRQSRTLLRANHVYDTLTGIIHFKFRHTIGRTVLIQGLHLQT